MTMAIFRENGLESIDLLQSPAYESEARTSATLIPLVGSKLEIPADQGTFERVWLHRLLDKYTGIGSATMVIGRAGTGKTCLVADFVRQRPNVSWYSIDPSDSDWLAFQRYFRAAWLGSKDSDHGNASIEDCPTDFVAELCEHEPCSVIVLDNLHHLFDRQWFPVFFSILMRSIPEGSHLILISRSKPPAPVWRLRSKQVLNTIDEKLLAFSLVEAKALFKSHGLTPREANIAYRESFGRAAELVECLIAAARPV